MEKHHCIDTISIQSEQTGSAPPPWVGRVLRFLGDWLERSRQRKHLAQLSDHMLQDIGLTRVDVWKEVEKPFWRL